MRRLFILILLSVTTSIFAQDSLRTRYGFEGSLTKNLHTTDFRALPGVPSCCPLYSEGTASGYTFNVLYEHPLSSMIFFGGRLGYFSHDVALKSVEDTRIIVNGVGQTGHFTHTVNVLAGTLGIEPRIGILLFDRIALSAGLRAGIMLSPTYSQSEVAAQGTFVDSNGDDSQSAIRNRNSGDLPDASTILLHGIATLGVELPVNKERSFFLVPEIGYALSLNDMVKGLTWKSNAIKFGLAFKFSPSARPPKPIEYDTIYSTDTIRREVQSMDAPRIVKGETEYLHSEKETDVITKITTVKTHYIHEVLDDHTLEATVSASGLEEDGSLTPMAILKIEEFLQLHSHPVLSYIFFEKNSSTIPSRYEQIAPGATASYKLETLADHTNMELNHSLLNIVGKRLRDKPAATLTITGCNDDEGIEHNNLDLSATRANAIKYYLTSIWGIDESRLTVAKRNLPQAVSIGKTGDAEAENRRVELTSDDPTISDVFVATDTLRLPLPPQIRFNLSIATALPVRSWKLELFQEGALIKSFADSIQPPSTLDWDITNDQRHVPRFNSPLEIKFSVENSDHEWKSASTSLPTEIRTLRQKQIEHAPDSRIEKYNLILFDFGSSEIQRSELSLLAQMRARFTTASKILIEGFTDRTGNPLSNEKLATARATAAAISLGRVDAKVLGIGDRRLLYPNDTPEGRFLCRTVQIMVRTPQ